jgi:hypothetical protein
MYPSSPNPPNPGLGRTFWEEMSREEMSEEEMSRKEMSREEMGRRINGSVKRWFGKEMGRGRNGPGRTDPKSIYRCISGGSVYTFFGICINHIFIQEANPSIVFTIEFIALLMYTSWTQYPLGPPYR